MKTDKERLYRMLKDCEDVATILTTHPRDFVTELALTKLIENIGEAARHISDEIKDAYPDIPWTNMIGMRNALVHEYFRIHTTKIWEVAEHKIPALKDWIIGMIEQSKWQ